MCSKLNPAGLGDFGGVSNPARPAPNGTGDSDYACRWCPEPKLINLAGSELVRTFELQNYAPGSAHGSHTCADPAVAAKATT